MAKKQKQIELTEKDLLWQISRKLDVLAGVIGIQGKDTRTQVTILTRLGLSSPEIGALLNLRAESVRRLRSK